MISEGAIRHQFSALFHFISAKELIIIIISSNFPFLLSNRLLNESLAE